MLYSLDGFGMDASPAKADLPHRHAFPESLAERLRKDRKDDPVSAYLAGREVNLGQNKPAAGRAAPGRRGGGAGWIWMAGTMCAHRHRRE